MDDRSSRRKKNFTKMSTAREVAGHAKQAIQVWRDCASARITLQSGLTESHSKTLDQASSPEKAAELEEAVLRVLMQSARRVKEPPSTTQVSWESINDLNMIVIKSCLLIADEWHEKTKGPNTKNLKALDQSISAQMEYVMADPDNRAVKRCRGATEEEYDDAPLYAALLKESVQRGASGDDYRAMKMASKFGKKVGGKEVDRRASKGRKVRYTPIEKLSNCMAARPVPISEGIPIADEELVNAFVGSVFQ